MSNDKQNPIQFLADKLINGKPFTTRDLSYYLAEAEAMYKDAIELAIIKQCAEKSTSEASKYADGYKEGYKRACDYMTDTIKNKIEIKENGSNTFSTSATTTTTRLCPVFVPNEFVGQHRCKNCGNERHQHTTPTNTP
jgi:hypothetical protein